MNISYTPSSELRPLSDDAKTMVSSFIKPRMLRPGDRVAAVSLSDGWANVYPHVFLDGKQEFEKRFGVEVVESRHALADFDWLAAHPEARAADLMAALKDPSVQGIISIIGGDDSIRLLPFLDLSVIRENPKVFLGYSDATVTHFAFLKAGVNSFYGPSLMAGFDENGGLHPYTEESVRAMLFTSSPRVALRPNSAGWTNASWEWDSSQRNEKRRPLQPAPGWKWLQGTGRHSGQLIGGCLQVMDWLRGSSVWPDPSVWRGKVLFLETSEDGCAPGQVSRMIRTMAAAGAFEAPAGLLVGRPPESEEIFSDYDAAIMGSLSEMGLAHIPLITRMDFGHTDPKFTLALGSAVEIDCDRRSIQFVEPSVCC